MNLFKSFFIGGFECADHINRCGQRINLLTETKHDQLVFQDYNLMAEAGIKTVREGICWSSVEKKPYVFDFSEVKKRMEAAAYFDIQQIWDLCHFGYPIDLMPMHPCFTDRFVALCTAFATFYRKNASQPLFVCPINEISFLSWHSGDMRGTVPFAVHSGWDIKYHLCKAAIKGIEALQKVNPHCRILTIEPLINIHDHPEFPDPHRVSSLNEDQFQAMDIIGGYICPELGGKPSNLDILGFNYYYNNQWVHGGSLLIWTLELEKEHRLSNLLERVWRRYHRPILLSETGHFREDRDLWLRYITDECKQALFDGVDLQGACIYPMIDRPDWDDLSFYSNSGIWDLDADKNRIVFEPAYNMLLKCSSEIDELMPLFEMAGQPVLMGKNI